MKENIDKLPSPWVSAIPLVVLTLLLYAVILILVMLATNNDTFKAVLGRLKFWGKKKKEVV